MKNRFGFTGRLFIIILLALAMVSTMISLGSSMPAKPVLAVDDGSRSGYSTVRYWNSTITGAAPAPIPPPAQAGSCDWAGDWKTNWGGCIFLRPEVRSVAHTGFSVSALMVRYQATL